MRKIKVISRDQRQAVQKQAAEGDVPPKIVLENFETILNFKPSLDLIEADPHNPPDMSSKSGDPLSLGTDENQPDQGDLVKKGPEYESAPGISKEDVPHEGEHVKQGKKVAEEEESSEEENKDENSENEEESEEERFASFRREHAARWQLSSQLAEIKVAAGLIQEIDKNAFIAQMSENKSVAELQELVSENEAMFSQLKEAKQVVASETPTPVLPSGFAPGGTQNRGYTEDEKLEIILGGTGL